MAVYRLRLEAGKKVNSRRDATKCVKKCKEDFLGTVAPRYGSDDEFADICVGLSADGPNPRLWPLYRCDSELCGVFINEKGPLGQDPNVDSIINKCQNIGYQNVRDPGPPPPHSSLLSDPDEPGGASQPHTKLVLPAQTATSTNMHNPSSSRASSSTRRPFPSTHHSTYGTTTSKTTQWSAVQTTEPPPSFSSNPPGNESARLSGSNLSTAAKAAIGAGSALGLLTLMGLVALFLIHRRRSKYNRGRDDSSSTSSSGDDNGDGDRTRQSRHPPGPGGSPTPLLSPVQSIIRTPLPPPLRLCDRDFLPSFFFRSGERSPSPPLTPLTPVSSYPGRYPGGYPGGVFPSSPICSPATNRLVPRHEVGLAKAHHHHHHQHQHHNHMSGSSSAVPAPFATDIPRGSLSSTLAPSTKSSVTAHSSLRNDTATLVGSGTPSFRQSSISGATNTNNATSNSGTAAAVCQSHPARPPRPHEAPLEIPGLVRPADLAPAKPGPTRQPPPPTISVSFFESPPCQTPITSPTSRGTDGNGQQDSREPAPRIGIAVSSPEEDPPPVDPSPVSQDTESGFRRVSMLREGDLERLGGKY